MNSKNSEGLNKVKSILKSEPRVQILGKNEILIENHKGIIALENDIVKIKTNIGILTLVGSNFNLLFMEGPTIVVEGKLESLSYGGEF